jgi:hypothetical protein
LRDYGSPPGASNRQRIPLLSKVLLERPVLRKQKDNEHNSLGTLISLYASQNSMDPRDKVYGLLGLTYDTHLPTVDYSKSVTKIFVDTIKALHDEYWTHSMGYRDGMPEFIVGRLSETRSPPPYMLIANSLQIPGLGIQDCKGWSWRWIGFRMLTNGLSGC